MNAQQDDESRDKKISWLRSFPRKKDNKGDRGFLQLSSSDRLAAEMAL